MMHTIRNDLEYMVRLCIQGVASINLQKRHKLFCNKRCWKYSIAFGEASNYSNSYLNVRLRIYARGSVHKKGILAVPIEESHNGENVFGVVLEDVLREIRVDKRKYMLISTATGRSVNITSRDGCRERTGADCNVRLLSRVACNSSD